MFFNDFPKVICKKTLENQSNFDDISENIGNQFFQWFSKGSCKKILENQNIIEASFDDVVDYEKIINEFALIRNKWLGLLKGLDQKQWQLTNIVKLRVAGMEDASL